MGLDTYALTTVINAKTVGRLNDTTVPGLSIHHSGTGVTSATVTITGVAIVLTTNIGTDTLAFANPARDTIVELVASINAIANWHAVQLGPSGAPSTDLTHIAATDVYEVANDLTLMMAGTWLFELLINAVSMEVESYLDRQVLSRSYSELIDFTEDNYFTLAQAPVTAVTRLMVGHLAVMTVGFSGTNATRASIRLDDAVTTLNMRSMTTGVETTTDLTIATYATITLLAAAINAVTGWTATVNASHGHYPAEDLVPISFADVLDMVNSEVCVWEETLTPASIDNAAGIVYLLSTASQGGRGGMVDYTAGWATTPAAIEKAVCEAVIIGWYMLEHDRTLQSETLADYSYTVGVTGAAKGALGDESILRQLEPYRLLKLSF